MNAGHLRVADYPFGIEMECETLLKVQFWYRQILRDVVELRFCLGIPRCQPV